MPGRKYTAGSLYRYGFNGKENDNEAKGDGNAVDFGDRIFDPRLGRWTASDRMANSYPSITPYAYAINSPLIFFDPNGKWVAKVDYNEKTKQYSLTFVAEKGDNLGTLALQLGIPKASLVKADPTLKRIKISTGSELKLEKIKEVNNINYAINFLGPDNSDEQQMNNCSNFANKASGNAKGLIRFADNEEATGILAVSMEQQKPSWMEGLKYEGPQFSPVNTEANSKIGDLMFFTATDENGELIDRHFAVVILKDRTGKTITGVMQKNGTLNLNRTIFNPSGLKIPNTQIEYKKSTIEPNGASIFRPKKTVFRNLSELLPRIEPGKQQGQNKGAFFNLIKTNDKQE